MGDLHFQSYDDCEQFYSKIRRSSSGRRISSNVYLEKEGKNYIVRLWSTPIVTYYPSGSFKLCTGGWRTDATTKWINQTSPARVFTDKILFVTWHQTYCFEDNSIYYPDGRVKGLTKTIEQYKEDHKQIIAKRRLARQEAASLAQKIICKQTLSPEEIETGEQAINLMFPPNHTLRTMMLALIGKADPQFQKFLLVQDKPALQKRLQQKITSRLYRERGIYI